MLLARAPTAAQDAPTAVEGTGSGGPGEGIALVVLRDADTSACPDEADLRDQVATRVGHDPFVPSSSTQVLVRLSRARRRFRADVTIGRSGEVEGERSLEDRDCGELVEATALLLSLVVSSSAPSPESAPPSAPALEQEVAATTAVVSGEGVAAHPDPSTTEATYRSASSPAVAEPEGPESAPSPSANPLRLEVRAAAGILLGWLPGSSFLVRGGVGVAQRDWSVRVEARGALDTAISTAAGSATLSWLGGALSGCGHLDMLALCGHLVMARSAGTGDGVDHPRSDQTFVLGAGASLGLTWAPWSWLRFEAEADLDVPLLVPEAQLAGAHLWQAPPVAGQLSAGAVVAWGG